MVDVEDEVNRFFFGRWKEGVFHSPTVISPSPVPSIWAYVDAQDGD